ncbi:MAG: DUF2284 domain-containing protein [Acidobacteriota bacterium]|jgi:predicted metal-binding protein|nr:DUF2284 domain-containing protein [Acidobacteriota bacterium]
MDGEELVALALDAGAAAAAVIDTAAIGFYEDFRKACEKNVCRKFDSNWMGPPAIGAIAELQKRVRAFPHGMLFQTRRPLKSNFDWKGMEAGAKVHGEVFQNLRAQIRRRFPDEETLPLNAGCCNVCERCAYLDKAPCRRPDLAFSSVEAYGMNAIALQKAAGIPCNLGKETVCFVGMVLFGKARPA